MKNIFSVATQAAFLISLFLDAATAEQLMNVSYNSGYARPANAYRIECRVDHDYTTIITQSGAIPPVPPTNTARETVYSADLPDAAAVKALITSASRSTHMTETTAEGWHGGPTSSYIGIIEGDVTTQQVKISVNTGAYLQINPDENARNLLIRFADVNCGHD